MAVGEFQVAVVNQSAHDIVSTCIQQGSQIPEIKYFIPALYEDGTVFIKDLDGKLTGVNDPSTAAITLNDVNITPYLLQNAGSRYEGLIPPENVTRALSDGVTNPATLRIRISKEIDEHNIGGEANAFFICDENFAVWITIYITSHAFVAGQKWEIVTDAVFESSAPITSIPEDPNPFNYKVASEILLPGIIVGSSADAMSEKAGYNISEFQNVGLDISNKRTVFLKDVEALTANVVKNCDNLQLSMETTEAVLPLANHTLTLNGNNINGQLRVSGAADNSVVLTGSNYFLNILSDNDNCLDVTGAQGFIVHNGKVVSSPEFTGTPTVPTAENGNSSNQIASTEFVQNQLAFYDVLRLKGSIDATANPDYPAANAGDFYVISHAGKIGGVAGPVVEKQDTMLCIVDGSALGDHATVGENWILGQVNTDVDLEGVISDHLADKDIVRLKGSIDASVVPAPDYPSANAGDMWVIEKAGRIGGPSGPSVEKNDTIMCLKDEAAPGANAGSHASVGGNWMIGQVSTDLNLGTAFSTYLTINKTDHGWLDTDIGKMVVKTVGAGGEGDFTTASADNINSAEVVGHISRIDSTSQFTINRIGHLKRLGTEWDALCGCGAGGLTEGDVYFLNTSGGSFYTKGISHLLPGNIDMPAFIALSATDVWYYGYRGAEVGGGTSFGKSFAATDFSGNVITVTHGLNTKRPIIRVFDENDQPVEAIQSRPTTGNELNAQDITFSAEMIAEMSSFLWHVMVIGTGVPYTKTEIEIPDYEPVAQQHGVKILSNGAIYSFDDWHGVEGFLTGDHAFVVPYKQSLSNVFTGFEVIGWQGNGSYQHINTFPGLQWIKNREYTNSHRICDLLRNQQQWYSDSNQKQSSEPDFDKAFSYDSSKSLLFGSQMATNHVPYSYISWNWHYPMAKAWHATGASSRKVPTPWGMVDSVESNPNSGLTGDQVITELYNPLTGNGCLLYIGTGALRTLDISGGITPEWVIYKNLTIGARDTLVFHSALNGGMNPELKYILLNSTSAELTASATNTAPTHNTIELIVSNSVNENAALMISYYFSPIPGLQNFGSYTGNDGVNNQATGCKDGMFFNKARIGSIERGWNVFDSFRGDTKGLRWNLGNAEVTYPGVGFSSDSGIDINSLDSDINANGFEYIYGHFGNQLIPQSNFDVYPSNPILANSSNNKVKIIFEYKGSAILNTELLVYATREPTPNWVQGTLTKLTDLSDGYQLLSADIDISANANNTHMRWRLASNESTYTEHNIKNLKITWS